MSGLRGTLLFLLLFVGTTCMAQKAIVRWAYGPFGTPGEVAYIVDASRIYSSCGAFGERGTCIYIYDQEDQQVYRAADTYGRRGQGAFYVQGNNLMRCSGALCSPGGCVLMLEGAKVFRGEGPGCMKGTGAFVIEQGYIHLAEGPFASKGDALFQVEGDLPMLALLAILAGH